MNVIANLKFLKAPNKGLPVLRGSAILSSYSEGIKVVISNLDRVSSMDESFISTNLLWNRQEIKDVL